jgi:hypothetical protein
LKTFASEGVALFIDLEKWGISTFALKIIAAVTMLIDHIGVILLTDYARAYELSRMIGRMSFPIFCFVLVEGYFHTKNRMSYAIRLGIFAFISEIPYDMMSGSLFDLGKQNVIFTLFFGFMVIWALDLIAGFAIKYPDKLLEKIGVLRLNMIAEFMTMAVGFGAAYFLNSEYSYAGVLLIICFYVFKKHHIGKMVSNMVFNIGMFGDKIQWAGIISILPIALYNGKPGIKKGKYFFYWFYPLHLCLLILIKNKI